ncbi:hypothetical protein RUM44_007336 [Polyplax serrata]|uniref:Uncharacterized protein n=1 Tax=Polyplax serrata TaxID=468196 RepID=A0ABR1B0E5_POLSC
MLKNKKSSFELRPLQRPKLKDHLNIPYALVRSVQYEQFLKQLGVDEDVCQAAAKVKVTVVLENESDTYLLKTTYSDLPPRTLSFRVGEEITREIPGGKKVKTVFEVYENKLIEKQNLDGKEVVIKRKFTPKELLVTMEINGFRCHRYYQSIESKHSIGTETSRRQSFFKRNEEDFHVVSTPPIESAVEKIQVTESEESCC